jgi:hypothetical protein
LLTGSHTTQTDEQQVVTIYRRDLVYIAEYATVTLFPGYVITSITYVLPVPPAGRQHRRHRRADPRESIFSIFQKNLVGGSLDLVEHFDQQLGRQAERAETSSALIWLR